MHPSLQFLSSRLAGRAAIGGGLLIAAAGLFLFGSEYRTNKAEAAKTDNHSPAEVSGANAARRLPSSAHGPTATPDFAPLVSAENRQIVAYTPEQAARSLREFFDKVLKQENVSSAEMDELRARLLTSIESDLAVVEIVKQFYRELPAEQGMERDILRSMLVASSAGRNIVLQEANAIWEGKSEAKFAEMYETYFNLPKQAPQEALVRALADLKAGAASDVRSDVARLNFIGTLEDPSIPDSANLRNEAVQILNQLAEGKGSEVVRALAVQKLYRLNSPGEASNIAIAQFSKGVYADLVRETLSSVNSGDVELTPQLRAALASAVKRQGASAEEKQQYRTVVGANP